MFKITILAIGKMKNKQLAQATEEYLKRLQPLAKTAVVELPAVSFSDTNQKKAQAEEGQKILAYVAKHPSAKAILLDETGQTFTSINLAYWLEQQTKPLILIIGGSLGISTEVKKQIKDKLALSALTLPHELARLVTAEQLYRAATILKGMAYHY